VNAEGEGERLPPPGRARALPAAAVLAVVLALGVGVARLTRVSPAPTVPTTPFRPGALSGVGIDGLRTAVPATGIRVVLYVSETCPFCAAELRDWNARLGASPHAARPLIILSPTSHAEPPHYLPDAFRDTWIHDADGEIGRRLEVRAVPYTAVLYDGVVTEVHLGRSSPATLDKLQALLADPPTQGGTSWPR